MLFLLINHIFLQGNSIRLDIKYILENGIIIVDDYAHHPSEVESTIQAAQSGWGRRLISIFQPHLFTRTRDFYQDFAQAFQKSDIIEKLQLFFSF